MLLYWLWFALLPDFSALQKLELLERFSDPEDIYRKYEISRRKCRYIWHMAAMDEQ